MAKMRKICWFNDNHCMPKKSQITLHGEYKQHFILFLLLFLKVRFMSHIYSCFVSQLFINDFHCLFLIVLVRLPSHDNRFAKGFSKGDSASRAHYTFQFACVWGVINPILCINFVVTYLKNDQLL